MSTIVGLEVLELPEGYTPLEAVAVIKALDENGEVSLLVRSTKNLTTWEAAGMLDVAYTLHQSDALESMQGEDDEE